VARDDKKRKQEAKSRLDAAMVACHTVLEAVLRKPEILANPEFLFLRSPQKELIIYPQLHKSRLAVLPSPRKVIGPRNLYL